MMHEREKSDPAVVAVKPVNNAERSAAEPVEPRAGAKGNAEQHSTCRAQYRVSVSQALERIRPVRRHSPEVGAVCGKAARTVLCGGRSAMSVPTAIVASLLAKTVLLERDVSMPLKLFELVGTDEARPFSPFCWRTRMALAHKGLSAQSIPWRFTEKDAIAPHNSEKVPVLIDGETAIVDSWAIAN